MTPATCPTTEVLSDYVLGKLPDEALRALAAHAADCPSCQFELQTRDGTTDSLILQIRRPPRTDALNDEPHLSKALRQAQSLATASGREPAAHPWLAPAQAADELGRLGPYRVLRLIGAGGMGMVYQGEDPHLRRRIALKVMTPALAEGDGPRQRFLREARAMASLTHDHIVPIYHVGEERGVLYLAMPFLEGETLESRLKRVGPPQGRTALPLAEVLRIGREIADGLDAAHARGLIHRDVKPSNVWLEAGRDRVKILDFGLSRALQSDDRLTRTGNVLGTPEFMSPEQANGQPLDARSDLFSLGGVLYLLCTGMSPFKRASEFDTMLAVARDEPPSPRDLNPDLPAATADFILHLLAKDPDRRPSSARAAADALEALGRPPAGPAQPPRPSRRRTAWVVAAVAGVAAALAVAFVPGLPRFGDKNDTATKEVVEKDASPARPDAPPPDLPPGPVGEAYCKAVAALSPRLQLAAITAKLKELNPGFDGEFKHTSDDAGAIWRIELTTDAVTNLAPIRALPALKSLHAMGSAPGKGKLADLAPLRGTKLTRLDITNNQVRDLSPLRALPLEYLWFDLRPDQDVTPLREVKTLKRINTRAAAAFWSDLPAPKTKP